MFASNAAKRRAYQRLEVRAFALVLHPGVGVLFRVANRCQKQISQESKITKQNPPHKNPHRCAPTVYIQLAKLINGLKFYDVQLCFVYV